MSEKQSNLLITGLIILLPIIAFGAGWLTNEYVETIWPDPVLASGDDPGFDLFWEAWEHVEEDFIGEPPSGRQLTYGVIRGALNLLNDPYTVFLEPVARQEEQINLRGNYGGIGVYSSRNDRGEIVLTIIPGNPAAEAGIRDGDVLLAIDGVEISLDMSMNEVGLLVRGEIGTDVVLTVRHQGSDTPVDIRVTRGEILVPSVVARLLPDEPRIGYVQLTRFSGESPGEVEKAVQGLLDQGADRLILDLRHNPGGLLDAAVEIADQFVVEGILLIQETRRNGERVIKATRPTPFSREPLVVLIDGGTASAAEILAGALGDLERATLVGQRSFGKGSVQLVYDLSDGSSVHVTSARWYTPSRHQIDQQGLTPEIEVIPSDDGVAAGRDEALEQAIEILTTP